MTELVPAAIKGNSKDERFNHVTVQFNAVIPKAVWEWKEGTSKVYMRFLNKELGNWNYDFGPGELVRYYIIVSLSMC